VSRTPATPPSGQDRRPGAGRVRRAVRRVLRGLVVALVLVLVLAAALVTTLATVPAARESLARRGLDLAAGALPGDLHAGGVRWPAPGHLELYDVAWIDRTDTLARVDTLSLDVSLADLRRRDVRIGHVLLAGVAADVPAMQSRFAAADTAAPRPETRDTAAAGPDAAFPRAGSLPPLPSAAVRRAVIRRATVVAAPGRTVHLDSLVVAADLTRDAVPTVALWLRGRPLPDVGVAWRLEGRVTADSLALDLAPLHLTRGDVLPAPSDLPLTGRLGAPRAVLDSLLSGGRPPLAIDVRDLAIDGDIGSWDMDINTPADAPITLDVRSTLPRAPSALLAALAGAGMDSLGPGALDTLAGRWARGGDPGLHLHAELTPPAPPAELQTGRAAVTGSIRVPGPAALAPLLPPALAVDDLGAMDLELRATWDGAGEGRFDATVNLGGTPWLDEAYVAAHGTTAHVVLDSLALRLPGLHMAADGVADRDSVRLALDVRIPDTTLIARWRDPAVTPDSLYLDLSLDAEGAWPLPRAATRLEGSATMADLTVPWVTLTAAIAPDTVMLDLDLPDGVAASGQHLDRARLRFAGAAHDSLSALRGHLDLDAAEPRADLTLTGYLDLRDLRTSPAGEVRCDSLRVAIDGRNIRTPAPWTASFAAADTSVTVTGLALTGDLGRLDLQGEVHPDSLAVSLDLALALALEAVVGFLPPEAAAWLPQGTLTADGSMDAAGATDAPWAGGRLRLGFAGETPQAGLTAEAHISVGGRGQPPTGIDPGRAGWHEHAARVDVALSDADSLLLRVGARMPLPHPGAVADSVRVELSAEQLDLARLQPLLPGGLRLQGRLQADPSLAGFMVPGDSQPDLDLAGGIALTRTRIDGPDGSWMLMGGHVELSGNNRAPVIRGGLDIDAGLIRLPEPPPSLLPSEGEALLWQAAAADTDTLDAATADSAASSEPLPDIIPDLTFAIRCPGSLWLRGQGLDVELAGDLALHLKNGAPGIEGELEARQGTMKQLGRVFVLRRGRIIFYSDEQELDPELDLELGVRVGEYDVTIELSGTASHPELEFSSSPDLTEGDIVSVLLFGKSSAELDEGQAGLMAERTAQIAAAYGSVKLQESVAKRLGVDVVSIAPREDDSETSALTVGKYLNPRVMVRYEQVLDEESAFFVHLDYSLVASQEWKLHTQVSQGEASGVEIKWEKDW
jgi:hypothetical protein